MTIDTKGIRARWEADYGSLVPMADGIVLCERIETLEADVNAAITNALATHGSLTVAKKRIEALEAALRETHVALTSLHPGRGHWRLPGSAAESAVVESAIEGAAMALDDADSSADVAPGATRGDP